MAGGKGAEFLTRGALAAASLVPPAVLGARFWSSASRHPIVSLLLFLAYAALLAGVAFLAKVYGKVADRWVERVADAVDRRLQWRVSRFERDYRAYVLSHHRFIDLKGLATRGDYTPGLEEVFVDVSLMPRSAHQVSRESLAGADGGAVPSRQSVRDFLGGPEGTALAVIGFPGTGKTTMLQHLALGSAKERRGRGRRDLPVLLFLRDHAEAITENPAITLPEVIGASLGRLTGDEPPGWWGGQLQQGRCTVLLDGLDEVAREEHRRKVSRWVERQIEQYEANDFVLTSRPQGYQGAPVNRARVLQIRRFTGEQIGRFVHGWYRAIERLSTGADDAAVADRAHEGAEDLLHRLRARSVLYDLAANPLLLTMIANVHRYRGALPGSRAELYGEICEVLLWRRREAKGGTAALPDELSGAKKEVVLRELAFVMMADRMRDIRGEYASDVLRPLLFRVASTMSSQDFLDTIVVSGLLIERERGLFAFAHLTFQEHLAALHIQHRRLVDVLVANVDEDWWRETTLLYAAREDPAPVVEACLASGTVRALALAFDCAAEATEFAPEVARRLEALREESLGGPVGSARRRLMTAITVMRALSPTVRLGETTVACARPVTQEIYRLFAEERNRPGAPGLTDGGADDIAVGMTQTEAKELVEWINTRAPDGDAYRLPLVTEALDGAFGLVAPSDRHTVWCANIPNTLLSLWVPEGMAHPWVVPAEATAGAWLGRGIEDEVMLSLGNLALASALDLRMDFGRRPGQMIDVDYDAIIDRAREPDRRRARDVAFETAVARVRTGDWRIDVSSPEVRARLRAGGPAVTGFPERVETAARIVALLHLMAEPGGGSLLSLRPPSFAERVAPLLGRADDTSLPAYGDDLATLATLSAGQLETLLPSDIPEWTAPVLGVLTEHLVDWSHALTDLPRAMDPADGPCLRLAALTVAAAAERLIGAPVVAHTYRGIAARILLLQRRAEGITTPSETIVLVRA
ncbi:NACHT domain-containing protein [Streptomyces sp. NA02950]|uniref:NACHT domain-containing protein n=1 Tax=Streptomyces sp. NA02950 TaxID=2742137 RepID=UPI00158FC53B|nr:NACHT domain-containing protein [Streptomyces sp. NA02950]QKV95052.1 NACHT domain-containing protein [Streptomyces sp. NA02950]